LPENESIQPTATREGSQEIGSLFLWAHISGYSLQSFRYAKRISAPIRGAALGCGDGDNGAPTNFLSWSFGPEDRESILDLVDWIISKGKGLS